MCSRVLAVLVATLAIPVASGCSSSSGELSVIVFTRENQWSHPSNPIAADALAALADERDWSATVTDDPSIFTAGRLDDTDVVVFSITSGNILDDPARAALESYFASGGGFVGTHSASSTEQDWPFYKTLVPATFWTHPTNPSERAGLITIENRNHPLAAGLPRSWMRTDEWYTFYERPEELGVDVVLALDESSLGAEYASSELAVGYHPLAWTHDHAGGRAFYTALGHTPESYAEPEFMEMLARGIEWVARSHAQ